MMLKGEVWIYLSRIRLAGQRHKEFLVDLTLLEIDEDASCWYQ
jgi:hypothetical protein